MADDSWKNAETVYDFTVKNIKGEDVPLSTYKGHVLVIVNVASRCGYTGKHYKELVELDEKFRDRGLRILAFPCNQFGGQVSTPWKLFESYCFWKVTTLLKYRVFVELWTFEV